MMMGGFPFGMFSIFFVLVFALVIGVFIVFLVRGLSRWNKNNQSPRLTVDASVVAKRSQVSHHHNAANDNMMGSTFTSYFVTFQVDSGDRMELQMDGGEYGLLVEGDFGRLTFQGTRYLSFERTTGGI